MTFLKLIALLGSAHILSVAASPLSPTATPAPNLTPDIQSLRQTNRMVQVAGGYLPPGPVALSSALVKHKKAVPTQVVIAASSASASETARVQATDEPLDRAYLVNVTVGKSQLLLDFDTGSSDLWVFSTAMPASERGSHHLYKLGGTQLSGYTWDISYGDGSGAGGIVYSDTVKIGGVTVTNQAVECATSASTEFVTGTADGLVGLGFDEGNTCEPGQCYTFMHHAAALMPAPLFTATLRHGEPGEYDFGFVDTTKYTGALTTVKLTDAAGMGYWQFTAGGYSLNGGARVARTFSAIADTGTSLCVVDPPVAEAYYAGVQGAHYNATWAASIFPCANAGSLPSLGFWIAGAVHTTPAAYGVYGRLAQPAGYCYGGIQSNAGSGLTVLGDVWLKSQFVVFNYNSPGVPSTIAFAQQAGVAI